MTDALMLACVYPDMTYQYASAGYLEKIGWQGAINGVSLEQVHGSEALFQLREAAAKARQNGSASLLWQPDQHQSELCLQLELAWNPQAGLFVIHFASLSKVASQKAARLPASGLFDYTPQAVMVMDDENRIVQVNPGFVSVTGYRFDEVVGQGPGILTSGEIDPELFDRLWLQLHAKGSWEGEIWNRHKNGQYYPAWFSITSRRDSAGDIEGFVAQFSNITALSQDPHMLHHSSYDLLTGLPDRAMAMPHLAKLLLLARQVNSEAAVALLELEGFSGLQETLTAEELLKDVAACLAGSVREADFVAILEPGRFLLLLPDPPDEEMLAALAHRVLEHVEEELVAANHTVCKAGIGLVLSGDNELSPEQMLECAEQALGCAFGDEENRYQLYAPDMFGDQDAGFITASDLNRALSEDEWELRFNPVYSLQDHTLIGTEIEPCWRDPERGVIHNEEYVPILARMGKLEQYHDQLGDLLRRFTQVWAGFDAFESIHMRLQDEELLSLAFVPGLLRAMFRHQIAPQRLLIQVSVNQATYLRDELDQIRAQGVRVLIGGHADVSANLNRLKALDPDMLLLDAELVEGQMQDDHTTATVETVLEMAAELQIKVLAEGVRTTGQMTRLSQQGCYRMCGKYVGRWLTMDQLIERLDMEI
ncbi:EAL domain-containing protein [Amphritea sp. HPY]|uniref:EAL domain-containing protein n=1 Tax=Amphritea sp. HPY TaxID=3421652 RepID=UPI003D7C52B4